MSSFCCVCNSKYWCLLNSKPMQFDIVCLLNSKQIQFDKVCLLNSKPMQLDILCLLHSKPMQFDIFRLLNLKPMQFDILCLLNSKQRSYYINSPVRSSRPTFICTNTKYVFVVRSSYLNAMTIYALNITFVLNIRLASSFNVYARRNG